MLKERSMSEENHPAQGIDPVLFLIISTPVKPHEQVMAMLPTHLERQMELERQGILFSAGPLFEEGSQTPSAGCIIIRAKDFEAARKIADGDPMHANGLRSYEIRRWKINEGSYSVTFTYSDHGLNVT
jgi:uncharacterized protein